MARRVRSPNSAAPAIALAMALGALGLSGCTTDAPGKDMFVKPADFPVSVNATADSTNGSVFPADASGSLYGNQTFWQAGDIVTINVALATTAQDNDSGSLSKSSSVADSANSILGIPLHFGSVNGSPVSPTFNTSNQQQFAGTGATAGSNTVTTQLAAVVLKVEPNGVLALSGRTNVNINGNVTGVEVSGYARPQDIGANNTLNSAQLADANIQYVGVGAINSAHRIPWFEGLISQFWPF
jgi:flagellar L-ring protein FlgH